jgi:hypothetical protein
MIDPTQYDPMRIKQMAERNGYQVRMILRDDGRPGRTFVIENEDDWAYFRLNPLGFARAEMWLSARTEHHSKNN